MLCGSMYFKKQRRARGNGVSGRQPLSRVIHPLTICLHLQAQGDGDSQRAASGPGGHHHPAGVGFHMERPLRGEWSESRIYTPYLHA